MHKKHLFLLGIGLLCTVRAFAAEAPRTQWLNVVKFTVKNSPDKESRVEVGLGPECKFVKESPKFKDGKKWKNLPIHFYTFGQNELVPAFNETLDFDHIHVGDQNLSFFSSFTRGKAVFHSLWSIRSRPIRKDERATCTAEALLCRDLEKLERGFACKGRWKQVLKVIADVDPVRHLLSAGQNERDRDDIKTISGEVVELGKDAIPSGDPYVEEFLKN